MFSMIITKVKIKLHTGKDMGRRALSCIKSVNQHHLWESFKQNIPRNLKTQVPLSPWLHCCESNMQRLYTQRCSSQTDLQQWKKLESTVEKIISSTLFNCILVRKWHPKQEATSLNWQCRKNLEQNVVIVATNGFRR